ncbi:MAG: hypothetical protein IJH61_07710, partial [Eubacteriaceae bacterium]|nr:hypothetical protein [Eubacteriaceae bacterium]
LREEAGARRASDGRARHRRFNQKITPPKFNWIRENPPPPKDSRSLIPKTPIEIRQGRISTGIINH